MNIHCAELLGTSRFQNEHPPLVGNNQPTGWSDTQKKILKFSGRVVFALVAHKRGWKDVNMNVTVV